MSKIARDPLYRRHRFPAEIIAHAVWLYFRFPLSLRMVEDMLAARGIIVTHQTIRDWAEKFGRHFANEIRRRSAGRLGDKWHLDEVVVSIAGKKCWLWRAVDQEGFVIDVLVQSRRNAKAARRLMRKLLKTQGRAPRVMITDKLRSYDAAKRQIMPGVEHRSHKGLEQSGGKFAPADPTTGEDHETLQVDATASAFRLHPRSRRQPVPLSPPQPLIVRPPRSAIHRYGDVAPNLQGFRGT